MTGTRSGRGKRRPAAAPRNTRGRPSPSWACRRRSPASGGRRRRWIGERSKRPRHPAVLHFHSNWPKVRRSRPAAPPRPLADPLVPATALASDLSIHETLSSVFRDPVVENEWLRERHALLDGQSPMSLLLDGSMEGLLWVKEYVELTGRRWVARNDPRQPGRPTGVPARLCPPP